MAQKPLPLKRPLVIIGGTADIGIGLLMVGSKIKRTIDDDRVLSISNFVGDFEDCRSRVIRAVDERFPTNDPHWTTEVDVVAMSMGGLVGRYAAAPSRIEPGGRRLRIANFYSLSVPNRGARWAKFPSFFSAHVDMRPGSTFLQYLDMPPNRGSYPIFAYTRLTDQVVGQENTAPTGGQVWWVPNPFLGDSHGGAHGDDRILADVARRLRGQTPYSRLPAAPLPP
jgi:hypothetical protein